MKLARLLLLLRRSANSLISTVSSFTTFANPSFAQIDTTTSDDLSADGFTWAQAFPIVFDEFDNVIIDGQRYQSGNQRNGFIFKNNGDAWADNTAINDLSGFGEILTRRSFVYDQTNQLLHGYLYFNADVVVYRRYTISRSGNDISAINWTRGVDPNLVFSATVTSYAHPIALLYGTQIIVLVSISSASAAQIIAVRANANNTDALTDFTNIGFNSTDALHPFLTASYSTIVNNAATGDLDPAALILNDGTLLVAYCRSGVYRFKRVSYNGTAWDTLGSEKTICNVQVAGTDTGYSLKRQLISKPVQIGSDVYVGIAVWKSNVLGDTVRIAKIASDDTVTFLDIYSANGAHSYAPTLDIAYLNNKLVATYLETTTEDTYGVVIGSDFTVLSTTKLVDTVPSDIPLIASESLDGKMLVIFRRQGSQPQPGYYGTVEYA